MIGFLRWARSIVIGTLNGVAKFALFLVLLLVVLIIVGLAEGDGLPSNMVVQLDLRQPIEDSSTGGLVFANRPVTVMDIVLGLAAAESDPRVKGVIMRLGSGNIRIAQAEEIDAALLRLRHAGKFVIAHSQGFESGGLGDYLTASAAEQIWMQPKSPFSTAGVGGGEIFLRGLFDKIQAEPQIAKRAEYKSAADMFMEKSMTPADREQLTALMQSAYAAATSGAAAGRKLDKSKVIAAFEASPQFTENAMKAGLIDRIGYDDDALGAALSRAGEGAKPIKMSQYVRTKLQAQRLAGGPRIAVVQAAGEIVEGTAGANPLGGSNVIASDDLARAIREVVREKDVKAIVLRVDSPGGSVSASDQILDAVKKAQASGKPVVVSMGSVAASGGYYISASADKIVAEPGTLTGSIGVLTGKVAIGKTLGLIGVGSDEVGVGKNALMDSGLTPYTPEQWAAVNTEADVIYDDFMHKVAAGRKLPFAKVQDVARGRVWTGADAHARGLVDELGGFWTAVAAAKKLAGIAPNDRVVLERVPREKGLFEALGELFGGSEAGVKALQGLVTLFNAPAVQQAVTAVRDMPRQNVELRAVNLPRE